MALIGPYLAMLLAFLAIDAVGIRFLIFPLFMRYVPDLLRPEMGLGVALGFYVFYVAGLYYLAVLPGLREASLGLAVLNGAVLGFLAYGTYEATNMATLKGWAWPMLFTDLTWGTFLTALIAAIGYGVARWLQ